jgi:peroxiredoxin
MPMTTMLRAAKIVPAAVVALALPILALARPQEPPKPAEPAKPVTVAPAQDAANAALNAMIGKPAPAFMLPDQNDKNVSLSDSKGKWVVLAFYPADMTRGCTFQNKSYSDNVDKFAPLNAVVYTVSTQGTASKREFCSKEGLKNTLLSDEGGKVATSYGVFMPERKIARRVTFYIAPDGTIAAVDTKPNVQQAAPDSIAKLQELAGKTVVKTVGGDPAVVKQDTPNAQFVGPAATKVAVGAAIADFGLPDATTGKSVALTTLAAGKKATVIMFVSTECPVSNSYNERMNQLATSYKDKGVQFIAINANDGETSSAVASHARSNDFTFPVLKDEGNKIADRFEAKVTPEVYVMDAKGICVYHGAIDNNQNTGSVTKKYLADTLDAVLAGQEVPQKQTRAFGCSIKRARN